jgi:hypothetical protein
MVHAGRGHEIIWEIPANYPKHMFTQPTPIEPRRNKFPLSPTFLLALLVSLLLSGTPATAGSISIYPDGTALFQYTNKLTFAVTPPSYPRITLTLDGVIVVSLVNFSGSFVTNINLTLNTNHLAVLQITDINNNTASENIPFDTFKASYYQWEAEDYDYTNGQYFDSGVDQYANLNATADVDFHGVDLGGPYIYRPTGSATGYSSDLSRTQFAGQTDYDAFFTGGEWGNYTRHYPSGTYYVWSRYSAGAGGGGCNLSVLTSGYGTPTQTTNLLGTFTMPDTGGWSSHAWTPLRDDSGNLVQVTFDGSPDTLKLSEPEGFPAVNVNFLLLVPVVQAILLPPVQIIESNVLVSFPTLYGLNYQVEYKNDLTDPSWTTLGSPVAGDGTVKTVVEPAGTRRFYRLGVRVL